ncbi:MAG TPA: hypothetical protein DEE98_08735 [Elusimicrobia bacterium]|nr:MAG: hypothetical protein A2204_04525 [Elusimicrobia bacterium RIFOXYA1_FULL_47_7]OGS10844.1 MAG: hypothetical protein A2386_03010 [Elusimicrobia bacterium RIFOXYB1_FULL_48_9]OGS15691.1 MAG: hypothetical protein A2251_08355 [Elusimicrobia bacterium RIFOXYA2_FULL_47_53]OGS27090.1 MAG: hypothetical protein A2339_01265 [Elusimicrobia bacterium RIFOXYB12_FULL_50_12]OGS30992.1 MAG: hypothetical protein A2323_06675 [Elusimicrobia bacterium RIFOXYB2_FULL_46_23]HBU70447.1 hypothetical protein [Elus
MIEAKNNCFELDSKPFFVYSGEIHYFRIAPSQWDKHLAIAKRAGLNTVSSYIPWSWHEPEEGVFDFDGKTHPQRNLLAYLKKVRKAGLKFIARVGPVSNAEMVNEGIPSWLLEKYPEVFVKGKEVTNLPHVTLLSYLNDTFQSFTSKWHDELLPIISENQYPAGNIILVQLCNEIGMVHWLNKAADYSPKTEKMYSDFLKNKYAGIADINSAYKTAYKDFPEIRQPSDGRDSQNKVMLWDWMNFYQHYYANYFALLNRNVKKHGIALPVLANIPQFYDFDVRGRGIYSPMTTMMFRDFAGVEPKTVFGGAYQMRRLDYENFHDISITSEVVKMITSPGVPSICAELQTGIMRDRPRLYPQDVELNLKISTAHGLNALNCYMFSGGKNEPVFGAFGTYHEWQAPVGPKGEIKSHYKPISDFGSLVKTFGAQLAKTRKKCDAAVGFYPPLFTTEYLSGPQVESWEWNKTQLFYDGMVRLIQLLNINFSFLDLQRASVEEMLAQKIIFVFSLDFMDEQTQKKLADFVFRGGSLVLNPGLPDKTLGFDECAVLSESLGVKAEKRLSKNLFYYMEGRDYLAQGEMSLFSVSNKARVFAKDSAGNPCGVITEYGKGRAVIAGFGINHMFDYQLDVAEKIASFAGARPSITVTRDIHTVLRSNESSGFLFLANCHDEARKTSVKMVLPGEKKKTSFPASGAVEIDKRKSLCLPLNLVLPGGLTLRYSTAEILDISAKGGVVVMRLSGCLNSRAELYIRGKVRSARTESGKVSFIRKRDGVLIGFVFLNADEKLIVK